MIILVDFMFFFFFAEVLDFMCCEMIVSSSTYEYLALCFRLFHA